MLVPPSVYSLEMTVDYGYNTEKIPHKGLFIFINLLRSAYITTEISMEALNSGLPWTTSVRW